MKTRVVLTRSLLGLGLCAMGLGSGAIAIGRSGRAAMVASDRAFDRGAMNEAVTHAYQARRLYAPGLPHPRAAEARLRAIALGAEATNRTSVAILAWSALRSAEYETRWFSVESSPVYREANRHLVRLLPVAGARAAGETGASVEDRATGALLGYLEQSLEHRLLPHALRRGLLVACVLIVLGAVGWGAPDWFRARPTVTAPRFLLTAGCALTGLLGLLVLLGGG